MFDIRKRYGFNKQLATDGVWIPLDPDDEGGARVRVASFDSPRYMQGMQDLLQRRQLDGYTDRDPLSRSEMDGLAAQYIVTDWEGIYEGDTLVPYSQENAERFLQDYPEFRTRVFNAAGRRQTFQLQQEEFIAKN